MAPIPYLRSSLSSLEQRVKALEQEVRILKGFEKSRPESLANEMPKNDCLGDCEECDKYKTPLGACFCPCHLKEKMQEAGKRLDPKDVDDAIENARVSSGWVET